MALDIFGAIPHELHSLIYTAVALAFISVAYKLFSGFLNRTAKRIELEAHALNALHLILRVITIAVASTVVLSIFNLPTEWFIGSSALIGAFLGFGASQTINNVVAGFYVLITHPFKVKDYVKIGDLEGQVEEITINYTNLYTPTFNLLKVPNTQVMNSRILNLTHEGSIKYSFKSYFDIAIKNDDVIGKIIEPAIEEFQTAYGSEQLRRPEYYMDSVTRLERVYMFRFFVPKGEAKKLYVLLPELLKCLSRRYDRYKAGV